VLETRRPGEQEHLRRLFRLRGPHLLAPNDEVVPVCFSDGRNGRGVRPGSWLGHAKGDMEPARCSLWQDALLQLLAAMPDDGVQAEDREMERRCAVHRGAGGCDFLEEYGCLRDAQAASPVLRRNSDAQPAGLGEGVVEVPRELVRGVALTPV